LVVTELKTVIAN